jgi:hypothetical protein
MLVFHSYEDENYQEHFQMVGYNPTTDQWRTIEMGDYPVLRKNMSVIWIGTDLIL